MSTFTVTGNLVHAPELRFGPSGAAVAKFTVAENRKYKDEESTHFFDCVAFGSLAENVSESLEKGARVVVTGKIEQRSWTNDNGDKRSKLEVVADEVGPSLRWASARISKNEKRD